MSDILNGLFGDYSDSSDDESEPLRASLECFLSHHASNSQLIDWEQPPQPENPKRTTHKKPVAKRRVGAKGEASGPTVQFEDHVESVVFRDCALIQAVELEQLAQLAAKNAALLKLKDLTTPNPSVLLHFAMFDLCIDIVLCPFYPLKDKPTIDKRFGHKAKLTPGLVQLADQRMSKIISKWLKQSEFKVGLPAFVQQLLDANVEVMNSTDSEIATIEAASFDVELLPKKSEFVHEDGDVEAHAVKKCIVKRCTLRNLYANHGFSATRMGTKLYVIGGRDYVSRAYGKNDLKRITSYNYHSATRLRDSQTYQISVVDLQTRTVSYKSFGLYIPGENKSRLTLPLCGHATVRIGTELLTFGGNCHMGEEALCGFWYNIVTEKWRPFDAKPETNFARQTCMKARISSLKYHTASVIGDYVYLIGGLMPYQNLKGCEGFRINWKTGYYAPMALEISMYGHSAVVVGKKILLYGGMIRNTSRLSNDIFMYDTVAKTRRFLKLSLPTHCFKPMATWHHQAIVMGRKMVVVGGRHECHTYSTQVALFDLDKKSWKTKEAGFQLARESFGLAALGGTSLFCFQGMQYVKRREAMRFFSYPPKLFRNGRVTVHWGQDTKSTVSFLNSCILSLGEQLRIEASELTLRKDFLKFYKDGTDADLIIDLPNNSLKLHSVILQARCPTALQVLLRNQKDPEFLATLSKWSSGLHSFFRLIYADAADQRHLQQAKAVCHALQTPEAAAQFDKICNVDSSEKQLNQDDNVSKKENIHVPLVLTTTKEESNIDQLDVLEPNESFHIVDHNLRASVEDLETLAKESTANISVLTASAQQEAMKQGVLASLNESMENFYDNVDLREKYADFSVVLPNETIKVQSLFLKRSSYFQTMLNSNLKEAVEKKLVVDSSIDPNAMKAVLKFLYCDFLRVSPEHALDVLRLSHLYILPGLKSACESLIEAYFDFDDLDSLLPALEWAEQYQASHLSDFCQSCLAVDFSWCEVKSFIAQNPDVVSDVIVAKLTKLFLSNEK